MGKPWVFWPAMLSVGVLSRGPADPWPSVWVWATALLLVGPVLAVALWSWQARSGLRRSPG